MKSYPIQKLEKADLKVLVLAKAMYLRGCSFAENKDKISKMLAIHTFDNSVEMILKLVAKIKKVLPKNKKDFYFNDLLVEIYKNGALKMQIENLHKQRNLIHHHADILDAETIAKYQGYVEDFLKDILHKEFNISYDDISLASLIENNELKEMFSRAEKFFKNERCKETIGQSEEILIKLVFDIADIFFKAGILIGHFGADELGEIIKNSYAEKYKNTTYYEFAKEVGKSFLQLGMSAMVMQFFDEYRMDFLRHRKRVENVNQIPEEKLKNEARESLNFVLNIILKWQEEKIL